MSCLQVIPMEGPPSVKITRHTPETDDRRFSSNFVPVSTSLQQNEAVPDVQDEEIRGLQICYYTYGCSCLPHPSKVEFCMQIDRVSYSRASVKGGYPSLQGMDYNDVVHVGVNKLVSGVYVHVSCILRIYNGRCSFLKGCHMNLQTCSQVVEIFSQMIRSQTPKMRKIEGSVY